VCFYDLQHYKFVDTVVKSKNKIFVCFYDLQHYKFVNTVVIPKTRFLCVSMTYNIINSFIRGIIKS
jgi:hypothetical protein